MVQSNQTEINQSSGVGDSLLSHSSLLREADIGYIRLTKKGWFLIHRQIWDDEEFSEDPFNEILAWIWLIGAASYKDKNIYFNKRNIDIKRGQLITSIRQLCKTFHWGNTKVENFLKRLTKTGKISRQQQDGRYTMITICNYETYQNMQDGDKTENKTQIRRTQDALKTRLTNIKESKQSKRNKKEDIGDKSPYKKFVDFWFKEYKDRFEIPYKFNKDKDGKIIKTLLALYDFEMLCKMATAFLKSKDEWIMKTGFTIPIFSTQANKMAQKVKGVNELTAEQMYGKSTK